MFKKFCFITILFLISIKSYAVDNLFITVKVLDYDKIRNQIKVEGISGSCENKIFFINLNNQKPKYELLNKEISLLIDSDSCEDNQTYNIVENLE